jgi:rubrerythrin
MATKTAQIIEILQSEEKVTQREIAKRVGCTEGYVSKVKQSIKTPTTETTPSENTSPEVTDPDDTEFESETSNFVKKVKITPDQSMLTDGDEEQDEDEEYECGSCGHVWAASKKEYQKACPKCGEAF